MKLFKQKPLTAYEAIYEAQKIAFAPLIFQAARSLRELGILAELEKAGKAGIHAQPIADQLKLSLYGVETLLESGLSSGIVENGAEEGSYALSKVGHYLLHDKMTRINMDYNHAVCYQGMYYLDEAIRTEKPAGLRVFGEQWETLYQALPHLPEAVQKSWYAFDHFYSDSAYPQALRLIMDREPKPRSLIDIGTNVARFTVMAAGFERELQITLVDLPDQLQNAIANVAAAGFSDRVTPLAIDLLDPANQFPKGIDIYWLSQFLSCFGHKEIVSILARVAQAMAENSRCYILETCWDRQQHEASSYALVNTSLYFTAMASGNSKMYDSRELLACIDEAGLKCIKITDGLGLSHSLFECVPKQSCLVLR
ncbi:MAG: SAM-dependent methyltransferase [Chromatiales bacterium]|nr:SAM-dependent methyltransferase [Gammaproteobacteria bacterium]MBW6476609.1 SAM-dependent methyltransferase [Chromatiales bacterium]